jgi:hypothetical protein
MSSFWLIVVLIINLVISCWDAFVAGVIWREATGWMKLVAWSAVIMSICGFISVYTFVGGYAAMSFHYLDPKAFDILIKLSYLLIIFPVLGAGMIITIHSWMVAWKDRSWGNIAVTGWNTFALVENTYDAIQYSGGFFKDVVGFVKSDSKDEDGVAGFAIMLVLGLAIAVASWSTYFFWNKGRRYAIAAETEERYA